ncbi:MAG: DNA polymerase I [Gemmataceae bacterium]
MAESPSAGSLYLLDAHGLIFQMFHGVGPMSAPDGRPTNAVFGVTRALMSLYDKGADYLIATLDLPGPTFRDEITDSYKAHRDPPPDDLLLQEPMIQQVMEGMRIPFLTKPGFEADDIMATVASEGAARGFDVFICSSDKDLRQCITEKVKILNLRKGEMIDAAKLLEDWGVRPEQVIDYQSLVGDSVDNVPGVPGVGPKTAAKWLQQFGTLDSIIANADNVPGGPKTKQALKDAIANGNLAKSKRLVTLDSRVPLNIDWDGWRRRDWDGQKLLELFHEFGFRGFAERVRKTLAAGGAKKNAEALAIAGLVDPRAPVAESNKPQPEDYHKRRPGEPSLFDAIYDTNPEETEFAFGANAPDPEWTCDDTLIDTGAAFGVFLNQLKQQKRFAFDLASTGYAFAWRAEEAFYLPIRGPKEDAVLDEAKTIAALKPIFEDPAIGKVGHGIKRDLLALRAKGVIVANVAGDPMIAHFLLHAGERSNDLHDIARSELKHEMTKLEDLVGKGKKQLGLETVRTERVKDFACEQAAAAWRLTEKLEGELDSTRKLYDSVELPLIGVLAEIESHGVLLDQPFLRNLSEEMAGQLAAIEAETHKLAGREFNLGSPKQLRDVLYSDMSLPVRKRTDTTGEASTDQETLERLAALGHELPKKIIEHRQIAKLKGTYVDALPALVNPKTGRLHTTFHQTGAVTGRLSSSDPNLQNIPARTDMGRQIRQAFIPPEGWLLLTADYSQVELRLLAHFCKDEALRKAFEDDRDVHAMVAAQIFQVPEAEVQDSQRRIAKTVNFGVIYGMSGIGLALRLGIDKKDANRFIDEYYQRYPKVLEYQQNLLAKCRETGRVETILGRRRTFDTNSIRSWTTYQRRNVAEREAINMEIQGSAADLMKLAMLGVHRRLQERRLRSKMLLTVHDELVFETPPDEVKQLAELVRGEMTTAMKLDVPLKVDVAAGKNWLEVEDV